MRTPTIPICVVMRRSDVYYATILNPNQSFPSDDNKIFCARGTFEVLGMFEDKGFEFSKLRKTEIPKWVTKLVPAKYLIVGTCNITAIPF